MVSKRGFKMKKLYKKTSTGKIQEWSIKVEGNKITSFAGQVGGKIKESSDVVLEGKNIGKANETTPEQQAQANAESKWTKKKKSGYVESIEDAQNDKTDKLITGGYLPTLLKKIEDCEKHIKYPCFVQPKLDGGRGCFDGEKIRSRTRKEIISVPHIAKFLVKNNINESLDGELYNHMYCQDFEHLTHIINQKKTPTEDHETVQLHIFDIPSDKPFYQRSQDLDDLADWLSLEDPECCPIKIVPTYLCYSREDIETRMDEFLEEGYEGLVVRDYNAPYEYKRSKAVLKYKKFDDAEFEIIDVIPNEKEKFRECGKFICKAESGNNFEVVMNGSLDSLKEYLTNKELYIGKHITVRYFGITNKNLVPRFPRGIVLRTLGE